MDKVRHDKCFFHDMLNEGKNAAERNGNIMIEIVYDKEKDTKEDVFAGITLPKNIRQIGTPTGNKRIYIEDYVMTYLTGLADPNSSYARGAILVGESKKSDLGEVIFISGALAAQNLELDLEESTFDDETWGTIYKEVKTYFPDLSVVGWFLSRMGFSTEVNDMILKLHVDNFSGDDKVLYIMDSLENEDAFYMIDNNYLCRQSGYYIYYARNEAMQNFMILSKGEKEPEKEEEDFQDEAIMKNYRRIMEERGKASKLERMNQRLYALCSFLAIAVLGLGIAVFSNYQMLGKMENYLAEKGVDQINAEAETKEVVAIPKTEHKKEITTERAIYKVKNAVENLPKYYTVQNGDTLSSISFKMYNSVGYVAELMEANGLDEADQIHEGDKIMIPTIKQ